MSDEFEIEIKDTKGIKKGREQGSVLQDYCDRKYCKRIYRKRYFNEILSQIREDSRFDQTKEYIQHGNVSVYRHSINVAYYSLCIAMILGMTQHKKDLVRGALLHDYFLYDWHESDPSHRLHGFRHPGWALRNAQQNFDMSPIEQNIIKRHMFPLTPVPPRYKEAVLVCIVDKICSVGETMRLMGRSSKTA